jgi:hypothetical protein
MCPVHYPLRGRCSSNCLPNRHAFRRTAQALRTYWFDRKQGTRPMSKAEYFLRFEREPR